MHHMNKQSGMTMMGAILVIAAVVLVGIIGMKTMPAYAEFYNIQRILETISEGTNKSRSDIVEAFDKRRRIDNIEVINGNDLILRDGEIVAEYEKVVPLFGNVSLLLEFNTQE